MKRACRRQARFVINALQSYSLYMLALVHLGKELRSATAWGWLIAGVLVWAPQDIRISMQAYVWPHIWMDGFALIVLLPPMVWLFIHDRRSASQGSPFAK